MMCLRDGHVIGHLPLPRGARGRREREAREVRRKGARVGVSIEKVFGWGGQVHGEGRRESDDGFGRVRWMCGG